MGAPDQKNYFSSDLFIVKLEERHVRDGQRHLSINGRSSEIDTMTDNRSGQVLGNDHVTRQESHVTRSTNEKHSLSETLTNSGSLHDEKTRSIEAEPRRGFYGLCQNSSVYAKTRSKKAEILAEGQTPELLKVFSRIRDKKFIEKNKNKNNSEKEKENNKQISKVKSIRVMFDK